MQTSVFARVEDSFGDINFQWGLQMGFVSLDVNKQTAYQQWKWIHGITNGVGGFLMHWFHATNIGDSMTVLITLPYYGFGSNVKGGFPIFENNDGL